MRASESVCQPQVRAHTAQSIRKNNATTKIITSDSRHGLNWPASYCRHKIVATGALGGSKEQRAGPNTEQATPAGRTRQDKDPTPAQKQQDNKHSKKQTRTGQPPTPSQGNPHEATDKATRQASAAGKQANKQATDTQTKQAGRQQQGQAQAGKQAGSKQAGQAAPAKSQATASRQEAGRQASGAQAGRRTTKKNAQMQKRPNGQGGRLSQPR